MKALAWTPNTVLLRTASRRRSPVEIFGYPNLDDTCSACVPLPTPGAPKNISRITSPAPALQAALRQKPFIVSHEHVGFNLLGGVQPHANHNQQRCSAKIKWHVQTINQNFRN